MLNKTKNSDWVYLDESDAINHKYYGIKGWAKLLAVSLLLPLILNIIIFITPLSFFEIDSFIYTFFKTFKFNQGFVMWTYSGVNFVLFYLLKKHNSDFQKYYALYFLMWTVFRLFIKFPVILYAINFQNQYYSFTGHTFMRLFYGDIQFLMGSIFWLLYVLKSKRINLTIRGRIKKKNL
jgi:hypothetical protein